MFQRLELIINFSLVEGQNGYPIFDLQAVGIGCVIYKNNIGELSVDDSEILYIYAFSSLETVLSKEAMSNEFILRIQVVQHYIGIAGVAGCENHNFEFLW